MGKLHTIFVCQQCGNESPKWMGRCPSCGEWNSLVETKLERESRRTGGQGGKKSAEPQKLSQIKSFKQKRIKTNIEEFDRVLGGGPPSGEAGIVPGSVVLVAGEPGIGKSTLMLQLLNQVGGLYITGEESLQQIKLRAERLGVGNTKAVFLAETDVDVIVGALEEVGKLEAGSKISHFAFHFLPSLLIIDSIQTLSTDDLVGTAGSVGQVRECTSRLLKVGKAKNLPIFLVGHITKEGAIAGPKVLEHMVDTVLYFEGERYGNARLLRTTKNRYGATDEVGVFEMTDKGLIEVDNPSKLFLKERQKGVPGSVVVATIEGSRTILTEIQALVVPTQLAMPRRVGRGVDYNRLQLIVAVLSKRLGLPLANHDVFVNVAGGLLINEPAADLGVALAIVSSFKNIALNEKTVVFGELGLLGEIRAVSQSEKRAKEAGRLGFTTVISPEKITSINEAARNLLVK